MEKVPKNAETEEVEIRRAEFDLPVPGGEPVPTVYITYTSRDLPPALVTVPKAEWSTKREAELIREDLKRRRETVPEKIRI